MTSDKTWRNRITQQDPVMKNLPDESPSYTDLIAFARWTQTFWKHGIEIMRKNGLVIKSGDPMEKLAFTFYTDLCEIDREARHLFQEGPGDENYKDEMGIQCQTITGYPKPYEGRLLKGAVVLTPSLTQHYTELAKPKGKSVGALVNADLTALRKKRVAREEKRVWKEIEFERL